MTTTTAATTTTCVICGKSDIPAEGKHIHYCVAKHGRKVVSREYIGWFDGMPINYGDTYEPVSSELDSYVSDLLRDTAVVTADIVADAVAELEPTNPVCASCDTAEYGPSAMQPAFCYECVNAMIRGRYNRLFVDPPVDSPDPTPPPWEDCRNCGGAHSIQTCPELWSALRAPVATPTADAFFILPSDLCTDTMRLSIDGHVHTITAALIAGALGLTSPAAPNVDALLNEADQILASIDYTADYLQRFNIAYCLASGIITKQQLAERRAA